VVDDEAFDGAEPLPPETKLVPICISSIVENTAAAYRRHGRRSSTDNLSSTVPSTSTELRDEAEPVFENT